MPHDPVSELLAAIKTERRLLREDEANVVLHLVNLGKMLVELQNCAPVRWLTYLRDVGYHPREAARLQKLGASWWAQEQNGLAASNCLHKLPTDLLKLEWLCRLSHDKLVGLVAAPRRDLRNESRANVVKAVKECLGHDTQTAPAPARVVTVEMFDRVCLKAFERVFECLADAASTDVWNHMRNELETTLERAYREVLCVFADPEAADANNSETDPLEYVADPEYDAMLDERMSGTPAPHPLPELQEVDTFVAA